MFRHNFYYPNKIQKAKTVALSELSILIERISKLQ